MTWQPLLEDSNQGFFYRQEHVTPQRAQLPEELRRALLPAQHGATTVSSLGLRRSINDDFPAQAGTVCARN